MVAQDEAVAMVTCNDLLFAYPVSQLKLPIDRSCNLKVFSHDVCVQQVDQTCALSCSECYSETESESEGSPSPRRRNKVSSDTKLRDRSRRARATPPI